MKWQRWTDQEIQIIKDHRLKGSQAVVNIIKQQTGITRTMATVRDKAHSIGHPIKRPTKGWIDHSGKRRMRIPGSNATFSPDRQGLRDDQVKLQDGTVMKRAEMARLNRTLHDYYSCNSQPLKTTMVNVVRLDQAVYEVENNAKN